MEQSHCTTPGISEQIKGGMSCASRSDISCAVNIRRSPCIQFELIRRCAEDPIGATGRARAQGNLHLGVLPSWINAVSKNVSSDHTTERSGSLMRSEDRYNALKYSNRLGHPLSTAFALSRPQSSQCPTLPKKPAGWSPHTRRETSRHLRMGYSHARTVHLRRHSHD
jgi:hypothetical protein